VEGLPSVEGPKIEERAGGVEARRESLGQYHLDEGTYKRSMGKFSANSRQRYIDSVKHEEIFLLRAIHNKLGFFVHGQSNLGGNS
jgi:hypothetical protein